MSEVCIIFFFYITKKCIYNFLVYITSKPLFKYQIRIISRILKCKNLNKFIIKGKKLRLHLMNKFMYIKFANMHNRHITI